MESESALRACVSAASFWMPAWVRPESAWIEHAPFAFWLVDALRPRTIVELGTYSGYSYAAFCQTVLAANLDCRCYGIDHWRGDPQTGFYGEDIFRAISRHNDLLYGSFSQLIRSEFAAASDHFADGSVDLLHLDGNHTYEAVQSDYATWRPKLSKAGVILFHDTNVVERDFGVARLWRELCGSHKHFEFLHGHGLGVLAVGDDFPEPIAALFGCASDAAAVQQVRLAYSRLGSSISDRLARHVFANVEAEAKRRFGREAYLTTLVAQHATRHTEELEHHGAQIAQLEAAHRSQIEQIEARYRGHIERIEVQHEARVSELRAARDSLLVSSSWRLTRPFRAAKRLSRRLLRSVSFVR